MFCTNKIWNATSISLILLLSVIFQVHSTSKYSAWFLCDLDTKKIQIIYIGTIHSVSLQSYTVPSWKEPFNNNPFFVVVPFSKGKRSMNRRDQSNFYLMEILSHYFYSWSIHFLLIYHLRLLSTPYVWKQNSDFIHMLKMWVNSVAGNIYSYIKLRYLCHC